MSLRTVTLDQLTIEDESSFAHVAVYGQLKQVVRAAEHVFYVPDAGSEISWDRAVFLNLTYWSGEATADVLCEERIPADVVAHVAWHHLASKHIAEQTAPGPQSADALLFGEAIASAFDLYLVGRLLRNKPDAEFIETQVSIMGEAAELAGMPQEDFAELLDTVVEDPERAFEDLRALLFDVSRALLPCRSPVDAERALAGFASHRFEALLHHYQLSNWVLYARAYGTAATDQAEVVQHMDATLRAAPVSLDWLVEHWVKQHPRP